MLPQSQYLKSWSRLCSVYRCHLHRPHPRLFTSSAVKFECDDNADKGNSFGNIAASLQKDAAEKNINRFSKRIFRQDRAFPKPVKDYSLNWKDSPSPKQDNAVDKWHQYKDAEYQDRVVSWGRGQLGDAEENYARFVSRRTPRPGDNEGTDLKAPREKYSYQNAVEYSEDDLGESSFSDRTQKHFTGIGGSFGRLNPVPEEEVIDEGDLREEKYYNAKMERRHRPQYYGFQMKRLCKERKLREAIKILEEEMPAAGAKPNSFCYQVLINECGRAGYTKKAFQLYNQMKKRGLEVQPVAYTGLFLACANSPWATTDGLQRATHLRSLLKEKGIHVNQIVSHAMIKAFGWCGDMGTAFSVVDEMVQDGVLVTTETMNFLLQACITDKEVGFRHAIKVWRKMRELKLHPDIHSYNLLMRIVKECGAGDPNITSDLLSEEGDSCKLEGARPPKSNPDSVKGSPNPKVLNLKGDSLNPDRKLQNASDSDSAQQELKTVEEKMTTDAERNVLPNIIGKKMTRGSVVALGPLNTPVDRLVLLGGPTGILTQMKRDRVTPDLKTFTQMLDSLPPDTLAEEALLESMKNIHLEPDTQFFNMLIKKRNYRFDTEAAQDVVTIMQEYRIAPDLVTFGCLASGCRTLQAATQFLKDMDASHFRPNQVIMAHLIHNSLCKQDYRFTVAMMNEMKNRDIPPDDKLLSVLEKARTKTRNLQMEQNKNITEKEEAKKKLGSMFLAAYKSWLMQCKVELPGHPWTQYR